MEKLLIKKHRIIILLVLILGFIVRFLWLNSVPAAMNRDEPAIGYNAYCILKTGMDEWGKKMPLSFKSFGDYKSPVYIYLTVLPVVIFGLNEFSVRFWSALAGFLLVFISYYFIKKLIKVNNFIFSVIAAILMAISSWQIFFSRFSFEANLALLINVVILSRLLKKNFSDINIPDFILICLSMLTYSSSLIVWPVFLTILLAVQIISKKNYRVLIKMLLYLVLLVVLIYKQGAVGSQKSRITVFGNPQIRLDYNELRTKKATENLIKAKVFYNQYFYYAKILLGNYINIFTPEFFFQGGGQHPWHKINHVPHLYAIYAILIPLGVYFFVKSDQIKKINKLLLMLFMLILPIPSAITIDSPHATRLLNLFFILTMLASLGLGWLFTKKRLLAILFSLIIVFNFVKFSYLYFVNYQYELPDDLLPGVKKAVSLVEEKKIDTDRVIYNFNNDGAYIYLLFYSHYPPLDFIQNVKRYSADTAGLEWVEKFDKYLFVNAPIPDDNYKEIYFFKGDEIQGNLVLKITANDNQVRYSISKNY